MAWSHLDITKPHLVYIILGGFTSLFMLCSSFIKERMYIGEATVATLCGVIFGPHAANLINPNEWGSVDIVTLEFSRIVLVVQCFAIGVELPKFYMEKHWRSVVFLLVPVMVAGWLLVSLFIWWMITPLDWLESLVISACVTATDPVLASSVVGKGKFAKRVPKHLRDLLSAESGCNDGMAFPFIYLSLYLIQYHRDAREVTFHFVVYVILYECIFGAIYGFILGYIARHGIKYAEKHDLVDRESFLVFYFVVALFCAGSGSILGLDDLLVGFSCGVGFSNDGWFGEKTEESHVSNVIDLLLNLAYFVYFGTIIPWEQYNNNVFGMQAWRLVVIAVFVLLFRRIPIMMALKPFIPDVKNWREALFAGHFGPIGVGAIFVAILARAELEHQEPVPLAQLPPESAENYKLIYLVWPIVTFLVISSILIHGSSIAVFTLGKRINTLTLTMSYTAAPDEGPSWMNRLPRISSQSRSQARMSEASFDERKEPEFPPGTLAPPMGFLRRQKDDDGHKRSGSVASSLVSRRRKNKKWDDGIGPGGPVSQSAIFPNRPAPVSTNSEKDASPLGHETTDSTTLSDDSPKYKDPEKAEEAAKAEEAGQDVAQHRRESAAPPPRVEVYDEGDHIVFENEDGEVLDVQRTPQRSNEELPRPNLAPKASSSSDHFSWSLGGFKRKMSEVYSSEVEKRKEKGKSHRRHEPARAYQFGNTIIVEDGDGEVVKTYQLPSQKGGGNAEATAEEGEAGAASSNTPATKSSGWSGFGRGAGAGQARRKSVGQEDDDKNIRFTIGGVGQRMTKDDFIREVQQLDARTRKEVVDHSSASSAIKKLAQEGPPSARMAGGQPIPGIVERGSDNSMRESSRIGRGRSKSISPGHQASASSSESPKGHHTRSPELDQTETPVERKRRLAVLANQGEEDDADDDDDSEDEGTERVPPARRGIRFAEPQRGAKKD
ncbi:sodium/hydrogen exchanger family domain-containing protein [Hirsutella rhossiliensis]|uniref:Sodium/hydrogen exchanger family domain-containing protein n=1 Tax=Hirsutella rhossiliensis TaxID=111463 RepID=A0A9P8MSH4_9HYPO|nr:sodium/hydrogen exchanger family domain-containing protein [Hirsutella rhossiliensis]KAH0961378.1 sodium/hydrogen exchanger family domain-containing protein [Hirsutella rhossiliensis]